MAEHAQTFPGRRRCSSADAQGDVGRQLSQIQNFIAQGAAAIIVNAADTSATPSMTKVAREAGVPLVYVNRRPAEETLPDGRRVRRLRRLPGRDARDGRARAVDEPSRERRHHGRRAGVERGAAPHQGRRGCRGEISGHENRRETGRQLSARAGPRSHEQLADGRHDASMPSPPTTTRWPSAPSWRFSRRASRPGRILVGGVDATPDALAELAKGTLAVTVFQNARGQARGAVEAAVKLSRGERIDSFVWIPFELVTRDNYKSFLSR